MFINFNAILTVSNRFDKNKLLFFSKFLSRKVQEYARLLKCNGYVKKYIQGVSGI